MRANIQCIHLLFFSHGRMESKVPATRVPKFGRERHLPDQEVLAQMELSDWLTIWGGGRRCFRGTSASLFSKLEETEPKTTRGGMVITVVRGLGAGRGEGCCVCWAAWAQSSKNKI